MKKLFLSLAACVALMAPVSASAIDLGELLGKVGDTGSTLGSALGGAVEGLFTKTDINVSDMVGTWTSQGSAVSFKSDNALKAAGGSAIAGTIESKLDPYFQKYGLTGSTLTVTEDGSFTLKVKKISLKGKITKNEDGTFQFAFTPFGSMKMGDLTAYVQKPPTGLDVMFDASKLKTLISAIAKFSGSSLASTASSILDSYEGLCVGFAYKK